MDDSSANSNPRGCHAAVLTQQGLEGSSASEHLLRMCRAGHQSEAIPKTNFVLLQSAIVAMARAPCIAVHIALGEPKVLAKGTVDKLLVKLALGRPSPRPAVSCPDTHQGFGYTHKL
jgi:hypothetical protein